MSEVKERLIGAITVMNEEDALLLWDDILNAYSSRSSLDGVTEVPPTEKEIEILNAFENGDDRFQPSISSDELKKELGL